MQFPNPIVKYLIIVDNNGFPVVTIGPGPDIKVTNPTGSQIDINAGSASTANAPTIFFYNDDRSNFAFINLGVHTTPNAEIGMNSGTFVNAAGHTVRPRVFLANQVELDIVDSLQRQEGANIGLGDSTGFLGFTNPTSHKKTASNSVADQVSQLAIFDPTGTTVVDQILLNNNIMYLQSGDGTALNGPIQTLDATTVQFKNTLAQAHPVQYSQTTKWMEVGGYNGWTPLNFQNGWSAKAGYTVPAFKVTPDGFVAFRGSMFGGIITDNTPALQFAFADTQLLPPGSVVMRPAIAPTGAGTPSARLYFPIPNPTYSIIVYGMNAGGTTDVALDGLRWSIDHL